MSQVKVFHYTRPDNWPLIVSGERYEETGLLPRTYIGPTEKQAEMYAVFGLLEPTPEIWVNNPYFKDIWGRLRQQTGPLLLEIALDTARDTVYVGDRGHIQSLLEFDLSAIPETYLHQNRFEANDAFLASLVPIGEYVEAKDRLDYSLPEVVIPHRVPVESLKVSSQQPTLEAWLQDPVLRISVRNFLRRDSLAEDLRPWRTTYEAFHGPLEISLSARGRK